MGLAAELYVIDGLQVEVEWKTVSKGTPLSEAYIHVGGHYLYVRVDGDETALETAVNKKLKQLPVSAHLRARVVSDRRSGRRRLESVEGTNSEDSN